MNIFKLVDDFHAKFGIVTVYPEEPMFNNDTEVLNFRQRFLIEEVRETCEAEGYDVEVCSLPDLGCEPNFPKYVDGLLDTIYVAAGSLLLAGLSPEQCQELFLEVQRANLEKERSTGNGDTRSTRKSVFDVVKPEGWTPPDIEGLLRSFGWRG